ncbi:MAG TPA: rod shape-determining protein RodA [Candidatus Hydrogenedentes bacterium]|nr:rod shape-determining protein RodA [Candidatus Hydrogenedentota bacterium]HPG66294.1 rod shape-determining protein RodA [Candidatus Hydrogenedentota bacterium]
MTRTPRDLDILQQHIRVLNPRNTLRVDWAVLLLVLTLAVIGFLCLFSASRSAAASYYQRQIVYFLAGCLVAWLIVCIDHRFLVSLAPVMYGVAVGLLIAVLVSGRVAKGGQRWLSLGPFNLQPSEQTKIILVYMLTWYFTQVKERIHKLPYFMVAIAIAAIPALLILIQPNLGTAACLGPLVFVMLYVAGCRKWHLALMLLLALSVVPLVWIQMTDFDPGLGEDAIKATDANRAFYELRHYQKKRIYTFLHPEYDPRDAGWQTYQSKVTIGSGGLRGKGFCRGTQTYLRYLPEHHNDFIFSLLAEEGGFVAGVALLVLFLLLFWRGLAFAKDCPELSGALLATGAVTILGFHVCINIAITVGLLPVTGIPLPFLSYGGSFYLTTMMCVGVMLNVPIRSTMFD